MQQRQKVGEGWRSFPLLFAANKTKALQRARWGRGCRDDYPMSLEVSQQQKDENLSLRANPNFSLSVVPQLVS